MGFLLSECLEWSMRVTMSWVAYMLARHYWMEGYFTSESRENSTSRFCS